MTATMPAPAPAPAPTATERATLPLLTLVARGAVDEDYAHVARRRDASGVPATRPGRRHLLATAGVAVFGLLIALAAVQTSRNASVDDASRALLIRRVQERRATLTDQKDQLRDLRRETADLAAQRRRTAGSLSGAQATLAGRERVTGFSALSGSGLRVTVSDAPGSDDGSDDGDGNDTDGLVRATDLRLLVNALWQSGAEGLAINGRRLSGLSSIVNAGIAVQVDGGPVSPPYVVSAVGTIADLTGALTSTATGQAFAGLARQFGFGIDPRAVTDLELPAAPASQLRLREARPVVAGNGARTGDQGGSQ